MSVAIQVDHLAYQYPGVDNAAGTVVFEDLNLTIEEGTFVAILGSNGCGKSTLAKQFNSILLPSGGKVYVCGMDTSVEGRGGGRWGRAAALWAWCSRIRITRWWQML